MKLELKESNSPFWLIGLNKGKILLGSSNEIPCYYKSGKKQYELAKQVSKSYQQPDEVYLITGIVWDNMKSSWSIKECGSYVQNKGRLIWSKNEITSYMEKYEEGEKDMNLELKEDKYPKGISRDPLPKNGVKVYTSVATPLESKQVKENMPDGLLTKDELRKLRQEVIPGSLYVNDYENSFNIDPQEVLAFFDAYIEDTWDKVMNYRDEYYPQYSDKNDGEIVDLEMNNIDSLYDYYMSIEDNTVIKPILETKECKFKPELKDIEEYGVIEEGSTKLILSKGEKFQNGNTTWEVMDQNSEYTLINALGPDGMPKTNRFAVVWGLQTDGTWNQGHYFSDINRAIEYFEKETIVPVEENKKVIEAVSPEAIMTAVMFTVDNWDKLKDIIETFKDLSNDAYEKALTAFKYLQDTGANIKDAAKEIGDIFIKNESVSLKESKIVEPIGNPQTSSSFVNIDVDLDHMEVSDFIVRLAQAVRSEQLAILEYVALRSANGVTNADRSTIDKIIEEEKNHLAAITTLLYKQILENHSENVDQANKEFKLPKFGMEIFDNTVEGKLQESLQTTINKLCETSITMSDDFYVGDREGGRIFHGLSAALNAVKMLITRSGDEVVVYNNTKGAEEEENKTESTKLYEEVFNNIDELIEELKTDTNYDEIAYHIHCYSHTDKDLALKLMDMLFDLEQDASPQECRDSIIDELESMKPIKEDTKITQNDKKYNVEVDVKYDSDIAEDILKNIEREAKIYTSNNNIELNDIKLQDGKFCFITNKEVNESDVENICKEIFNKASTLDKEIKIL